MCLDTQGSFSHAQPRYFERVSRDGVKPALIFADGGSPIAVLPDGNLYYVSGDADLSPGALRVARNSPGGEVSVVSSDANKVTGRLGVTGLAAGPDGDLYIACPSAVLKLRHPTSRSVWSASSLLSSLPLSKPKRLQKRWPAATKLVAQTSKSAVSQASKTASRPNSDGLPIWKSAVP